MTVWGRSVAVSSNAVAKSTTIALTRWILNALTTSWESLKTCGFWLGLTTESSASRLVEPICTPNFAPLGAASVVAWAYEEPATTMIAWGYGQHALGVQRKLGRRAGVGGDWLRA
jgi:hypothetical protein